MPSRSSRSPSETEERRDGRQPGSTRRLAHNQREQRRARRINDKIMEMKTMMESHGRNVKKDKYSILMSAVAHIDVLYELLKEEAKKNGSEANDLIEKRISNDTLHKEAVLENRAGNTSGQAAFRSFMSARGNMDSILDTYYYKHLFMETEMAQALLTTEGTFLDANRQFCSLHDIPQPSRLVGTTIFSLLMPFEVQRFLSTLSNLSRGLTSSGKEPDPDSDSQQFAVLTVLCISGSSVLRLSLVLTCIPSTGAYPACIHLVVLPALQQSMEAVPSDPAWSLRSQSAISAGLSAMNGGSRPGSGSDSLRAPELSEATAESKESSKDRSNLPGGAGKGAPASAAAMATSDQLTTSPSLAEEASVNGRGRAEAASQPPKAFSGPWRGPEAGKWPMPWGHGWPSGDPRTAAARDAFEGKAPEKSSRPGAPEQPRHPGMPRRKEDYPVPPGYPWAPPGMVPPGDMSRFGGKFPPGEGDMPMPPYPPYPTDIMPPGPDMRYPGGMDPRRMPPGPPQMWPSPWGPPGATAAAWQSRYPLYRGGPSGEYPGASRGMDSVSTEKGEGSMNPSKRQRVQ